MLVHAPGRAEFVCAMEDVLEVFIAPMETTKCWCLDETSKQQVSETRQPRRRGLGRPGPTITNTSATG